MTRETDGLVDELISDVARQMTGGDPSSSLRARVLSRLDNPSRRTRHWWRAPAVAGVAVVMLGLVVVIMQREKARVPAPEILATTVASAPPPVASVATSTSVTTAATTTGPGVVARRPRRFSSATNQPSEDVLAFRARAIPALDELTPLAVDGIQPKPLAIPLLVISPLPPPVTNAGGDGGKH